MYSIQVPVEAEYDKLLEIWESSVKATHDFLTGDDVQFFKKLIVENKYFNHVKLYCIEIQKTIYLAFQGYPAVNWKCFF